MIWVAMFTILAAFTGRQALKARAARRRHREAVERWMAQVDEIRARRELGYTGGANELPHRLDGTDAPATTGASTNGTSRRP